MVVNHIDLFHKAMTAKVKMACFSTHKMNIMNILKWKLLTDVSLEIITLYKEKYGLTALYHNNMNKMKLLKKIGKYL